MFLQILRPRPAQDFGCGLQLRSRPQSASSSNLSGRTIIIVVGTIQVGDRSEPRKCSSSYRRPRHLRLGAEYSCRRYLALAQDELKPRNELKLLDRNLEVRCEQQARSFCESGGKCFIGRKTFSASPRLRSHAPHWRWNLGSAKRQEGGLGSAAAGG